MRSRRIVIPMRSLVAQRSAKGVVNGNRRANRKPPNALARGGEDGVRDRQGDRREGRLTQSRWRISAWDEMHLDGWHLVQPQLRVIVKVALLDRPIREGDLAT